MAGAAGCTAIVSHNSSKSQPHILPKNISKMPSKGNKADTASSEPKGQKNKQAGGKQGGKAGLKDPDAAAKKKGKKGGAESGNKKKDEKKTGGTKH